MSSTQVSPASQKLAYMIMAPPFVGWCLQIWCSGICLQKALPHLLPGTKLGRALRLTLLAATAANMVVTILCFYGATYWGCIQQRDEATISSYTIADACVPTFFCVVAFIVQSYFAQRAWRVVRRSYVFLAYIIVCMLVTLSGGLGYTVWAGLHKSWVGLFVFTELYAWGGAITDLSISIVLMIGLYRQRTGYDTPTDSVATRLMRLSFQTAVMPSVFTVAGAVVALATIEFNSRNAYLALLFPTPSVYLYSFLYCLDNLEHVRRQMDVVDRPPPSGVLRHTNNSPHIPVPVLPKSPRQPAPRRDIFAVSLSPTDMVYHDNDGMSDAGGAADLTGEAGDLSSKQSEPMKQEPC